MGILRKTVKPEAKAQEATPKKIEVPAIPDKTEAECEVDGCYELKERGQNHVCVKHQRSS